MTDERHILRMEGITKDFPGVRALDDVPLELKKGEVLALAGENGAGKSTLVRILFGIYPVTAGGIWLHGQEVHILNPSHAQRLGIGMVHQELHLVPQMDVAQNVMLGHESTRGRTGVLNWPDLYERAHGELGRVGLDVNLRVPVRNLSVAQRQLIEIAKVLSWNTEILILDEPTSSLAETEVANLFEIIRSVKAGGVSIIFITHHMDEIFEIADRVMVLRDGKQVGTRHIADLDENSLIQMMVGRPLQDMYPRRRGQRGEEALRVAGLRREGVLEDITFSAYDGEILGISGLMGAGRTELARAIFGADPVDAGEIYVRGRRVVIQSPGDAILSGMSLLTEDRKGQGMISAMALKYNIVLPSIDGLSRGPVLNMPIVNQTAAKYVKDLDVKTPSLERPIKFLSGGNQQKAILAKWLCKQARVFIFDEPTRGIDVGAKSEIYRLMNDLAMEGACIIMISSELPEVLGMSDRILVMREGRLAAELDREQASQEIIMSYATGGAIHDTARG